MKKEAFEERLRERIGLEVIYHYPTVKPSNIPREVLEKIRTVVTEEGAIILQDLMHAVYGPGSDSRNHDMRKNLIKLLQEEGLMITTLRDVTKEIFGEYGLIRSGDNARRRGYGSQKATCGDSKIVYKSNEGIKGFFYRIGELKMRTITELVLDL